MSFDTRDGLGKIKNELFVRATYLISIEVCYHVAILSLSPKLGYLLLLWTRNLQESYFVWSVWMLLSRVENIIITLLQAFKSHAMYPKRLLLLYGSYEYQWWRKQDVSAECSEHHRAMVLQYSLAALHYTNSNQHLKNSSHFGYCQDVNLCPWILLNTIYS